MFGKIRVQITSAPRHIVIWDNGKRTRLYPVVVGTCMHGVPSPCGICEATND